MQDWGETEVRAEGFDKCRFLSKALADRAGGRGLADLFGRCGLRVRKDKSETAAPQSPGGMVHKCHSESEGISAATTAFGALKDGLEF